MKAAAIYARVSTTNHGQDPMLQVRELKEYCERRGWDVVGEYADAGVSGAKDSRPELNRLMGDGKAFRFPNPVPSKQNVAGSNPAGRAISFLSNELRPAP